MFFEHLFECKPEEKTYFALTYPFSYKDCQSNIDIYEKAYKNHSTIYLHIELLTKSIEKRRIDLFPITKHEYESSTIEDPLPSLFPEGKVRPKRFCKPTIFITARVHPGETQGSHMMNGLLSFLLNAYFNVKISFCQSSYTKSNSQIADLLLKKFVFKIIQMLNPDGVYKGLFRLDTLRQNLNR